jgi:hypothetical protein
MREYIHNKNTKGKPFSLLLRQQSCSPEKKIAKLRTEAKKSFLFFWETPQLQNFRLQDDLYT